MSRANAVVRWIRGCFAALSLLCFSAWSQVPPAILLAETYKATRDVVIADYWISEKLDGVRAIWDGKALRFRSGRPVPAPDWFLRQLPAEPLDGELWLGRDTFDELSAIVRKPTPVDAEWRRVRYMIFDQPEGIGSFSDRLRHLQTLLAGHPMDNVALIEQFRLPDQKTLAAKLAEVVRGSGEGLMLHRADAPYRAGRSTDLLKLKPWQDDEARVVAVIAGRGRLVGRMGALLVEMPDGQRFRLGGGFPDGLRDLPPTPGTLVTYRYTSLTPKGLPRFPRFWRIREAF